MGCKGCGETVLTIPLNIVRERNWPDGWIRSAAPNDLLLFKGKAGSTGGLLRLKYPGAFIVLTPSQVWKGEPFDWPVPGSRFKTGRIVGTQLKISMV